MTQKFMTCADCDAVFLDWFEDQLDSAQRASVDSHVASCARCQGLTRDVNGIRASASSLPDLSPSRDLWAGIEARIQPTVVSIGSPRPSAMIPRAWMAAAAAALVVVTSSVTYVATSKSINGKKPTASTVAAGTPPRVAAATVKAPAEAAAARESLTGPSVESSSVESRPLASRQPTSAPIAALASRRSAPAAFRSASERALAGEIWRLQTLLRERRSELEPATVQVVEENLAIIELAVTQARSALAKDPASGFLNERLEGALQKKVELLRTVALLRSST